MSKGADSPSHRQETAEEAAGGRPPFFLLIDRFAHAIEGCRELLDVAAPTAEQLDQDAAAPIRRLLQPHAPRIIEMARQRKSIDGDGSGIAVAEVFADDHDALRAFIELAAALEGRAPRIQLLCGALVTTAVGAFEALIAGLVAQHFNLFPDSVGSQDKEFSLEDLSAFSSIEHARELAVSRRVDAVMFGGAEEWEKWLAKRLDTPFNTLAPDHDSLVEIFQRRHVIVHNAGYASRQYLQKVSPSKVPSEVEVGTPLLTDPQYVRGALDELLVVGARVGYRCWTKWAPDSRDVAGGHALQLSFANLKAERWSVAALIAETGVAINGDAYATQACKCNGWVALKRAGRLHEVRQEVEAWDTSALGLPFKMVRHCLLNEIDEALDCVRPALASESITVDDLREWPILQELRDDQRLGLLVPEVAESVEWEHALGQIVQRELRRHDVEEAELGQAAEWAAQVLETEPRLVRRRLDTLVRTGRLPGQVQRPARRGGRWYVERLAQRAALTA